MWPGPGPVGKDRRRASTGRCGCHLRRAWHRAWPGVLLFCAHAGQTQADWRCRGADCARGLFSSQPPAHLPWCALALRKSSQRVRGGLGGDRDPCASSSSSPECQEVAAFMGVQAEFFWCSCHVPALALAVGVVRNTTDCGGAQGTPGRAWSKKGCQGGQQPTPFHHPVLPTIPGPTRPHLLHPVPWSHPPSLLRKLPCCPFYPSTPSVFLLRMPGGSRPATSAPNHLLSLDCCAPSEQSALWRLLIPPLSLQTLLFSPELPPHTPSQSLYSHCSPNGSPTGLLVTFQRSSLLLQAQGPTHIRILKKRNQAQRGKAGSAS